MNLLNLNDGKTKKVMEYIKNLRPKGNYSSIQLKHFEATKRRALEQLTAEDMLKVIGYIPGRMAKIYRWSYEAGEKKK